MIALLDHLVKSNPCLSMTSLGCHILHFCIKYCGCFDLHSRDPRTYNKSVVVSALLQQAFHLYHIDFLVEGLSDPVSACQQGHMSVINANDTVSSWLQHSVVYPVLLALADFCEAPGVRQNAVQLLNSLPTQSQVLADLRAALQSPQPMQDFKKLLYVQQADGALAMLPARLLYFLQASSTTAEHIVCRHCVRLGATLL